MSIFIVLVVLGGLLSIANLALARMPNPRSNTSWVSTIVSAAYMISVCILCLTRAVSSDAKVSLIASVPVLFLILDMYQLIVSAKRRT